MDIKKIFKTLINKDEEKSNIENINDESQMEINFDTRKFNFDALRDEEYRKKLFYYLKENGYTYAYKKLIQLENDKNFEFEVAKYLSTSNLIDLPTVEMQVTIPKEYIIGDKKYKIIYKKNKGFSKTITIEYIIRTYPFTVEAVDTSENEYISYEIRGKHIFLNINIQQGIKTSFFERVIIYRSYGVDFLEFNIDCESDETEYEGMYDFNDYIYLCNNNTEKASQIYYNKSFFKWLEELDNQLQIANYESANLLSMQTNFSEFELFCTMNNILLPDSYYSDNKVKDNERERKKYMDAMKKYNEKIDKSNDTKDQLQGNDNDTKEINIQDNNKNKEENKPNKKEHKDFITRIKSILKLGNKRK